MNLKDQLSEPVGGGVRPDGSPAARIWFFGEAPGAAEERIGKVFIGPAGRHLDMGFRDAGILRSEVFIWNIFQKRPPSNRIGYYFQDKDCRVPTFEGEQMIAAVRLMIQEYKPYVIVALGAIPLYILTGERGITTWRGSLLNCVLCPGIKVYPTFHPSYVMRLMQERGEGREEMAMNVYPTFVRDLQRAVEQSKSRSFPVIKRKHVLPETLSEVTSYLMWLKEKQEPIACDIETIPVEGELPIITRIGFAPTPTEGISIPFIKKNKVCWTVEEWAEILRAISRLMIEGPRLIFQNGFYDLVVMGHIFGLRTKKIPLDTYIQQHCCYPHLPKGLGYQASVYTWQPYYKDERKKIKTGLLSDDALSIYNIRDCCITKEIQPITWMDAKTMGMQEGLFRTMSLYPSLLFMMLQGVRLDQPKRAALMERITGKREEAKREIMRIGKISDFNPRSYPQMQDLLYYKMKFPIQFHPKTKKMTTNEDALNRLEMKTGHPIFKAIKSFRNYDTLITRYLSAKLTGGDRVYTSYDPTGTVTWRLSSYESHLGGGGNLQNIPKRDEEGKEIREIFIPDEGYILISADLAQAEDRYVNWKAGDIKGINDYLAGKDPHWENCKLFFDLPDIPYDSKNQEHYDMRNKLTKHANHANNYGMGPTKFRAMLIGAGYKNYTLKDCKELQAKIKRKKPMIEAWKKWVEKRITTDRTLISALNRKRIFYGRISDNLFGKAYAFEPQNVVGELLCIIIARLHDELFKDGLRILMNVHDEVVAQVPIGTEDKFIPKMKKIMEMPIQVEDIYGQKRELVIPVDFKVGMNWGKMEDYNAGEEV